MNPEICALRWRRCPR